VKFSKFLEKMNYCVHVKVGNSEKSSEIDICFLRYPRFVIENEKLQITSNLNHCANGTLIFMGEGYTLGMRYSQNKKKI
jgi:hypothetical protein